ncbi:MAG TPA: glycosyl transferase family 1, partial [Chloroflexota bacterium]|nr:glycosyl transferase family 1 [Chloroflexota bacterium]
MERVPGFKLDRLKRMTDDTGVVQHSLYAIPDHNYGYSIDDQARALIVALKHFNLTGNWESVDLATCYLRFLNYAQLPDGRFHNFMAFDRHWQDEVGSEDSNGRVVWALGYTALTGVEEDLQMTARTMLLRAFPAIRKLSYLRARAFAILGLYHYLRTEPGDQQAREMVLLHADALLRAYRSESGSDWDWFEDRLTYSNGRIPQSLMLAYLITWKPEYLEVARHSLDFLLRTAHLFEPDSIDLVGQDGWYTRGASCARYDQQPVDANGLLDACLTAHQLLAGKRYLSEAQLAFAWYHGRNVLGKPLYCESTGGCFDGLTPDGMNRNQGAESTI